MSIKRTTKALSDYEIDREVISQVDDDSAWGKAVRVKKTGAASVTLPVELAKRVAFLASLHREASAENWVRRIIEERVKFEEAAFAGLKRDLADKRAS